MRVQASGDRAMWTRHDPNLAAYCPQCRWATFGERVLALAEAGKLVCGKCGSSATVAYMPSQVRRGGVEAGVPAGVHAKASGGSEVWDIVWDQHSV